MRWLVGVRRKIKSALVKGLIAAQLLGVPASFNIKAQFQKHKPPVELSYLWSQTQQPKTMTVGELVDFIIRANEDDEFWNRNKEKKLLLLAGKSVYEYSKKQIVAEVDVKKALVDSLKRIERDIQAGRLGDGRFIYVYPQGRSLTKVKGTFTIGEMDGMDLVVFYGAYPGGGGYNMGIAVFLVDKESKEVKKKLGEFWIRGIDITGDFNNFREDVEKYIKAITVFKLRYEGKDGKVEERNVAFFAGQQDYGKYGFSHHYSIYVTPRAEKGDNGERFSLQFEVRNVGDPISKVYLVPYIYDDNFGAILLSVMRDGVNKWKYAWLPYVKEDKRKYYAIVEGYGSPNWNGDYEGHLVSY